MRKIEYKKLGEEIYTNIYDNPLGRLIHGKRFETLRKLVKKYSSEKNRIIDMCCGICEWNTDQIKMAGLDANKNALMIAKKEGRISRAILKDAMKNGIKNESFNIIVSSQALEHINNPSKMLGEFHRILSNDGILIVAVPYDTPISLLRPLMFMRWIWNGKIKGEKYYKEKGGHVNHFSPKSLSDLLKENEFKIVEIVNDYRFVFTVVARKINKK